MPLIKKDHPLILFKGMNSDLLNTTSTPKEINIISKEILNTMKTQEELYNYINTLNPSINLLNTGNFIYNEEYGACFKIMDRDSRTSIFTPDELINASPLAFDLPKVPSIINLSLNIPTQSYATGGVWAIQLYIDNSFIYNVLYFSSTGATQSRVFSCCTNICEAYPQNQVDMIHISAITTPYVATIDTHNKIPIELINKPCKICFIMDKSYFFTTVGIYNFLDVYINNLSISI